MKKDKNRFNEMDNVPNRFKPISKLSKTELPANIIMLEDLVSIGDSIPSYENNVTLAQLKDAIKGENIHDKLSDVLIEMILSYDLPYYGEFAQFINFYEADIPTCGINVTAKGMNFYWGRKFIETISKGEIFFVMIHEVFHLLFDHQSRAVGFDHKLSNLAQDMIINSIIHGDLMIDEGIKEIEIPKDEFGNNSGVFIPKDYTGEPIFEELYFWLQKQYTDWQNKNSHKQNKQNQKAKVDKDGNITIDDKKYCGKCGKEMKEGEKDEKGKGEGEKDENQDGKGDGEKDENQDGKGDGEKDEKGDGQGDNDKCEQCGQEKGDGQGEGGEGEGEGEGQPGDGQGNGQPGRQQTPGYGNNGKSGDKGEHEVGMYPLDGFFENIENNKGQTMDVHFDDDVPDAVRKQWVESHMEKLKQRGLTSGNVEKILNKLRKSKKDYIKDIKKAISSHVFGRIKKKTITRPNRRGISGLKGNRKNKSKIAVLLDTSGSMDGEFDLALSTIFRNDVEMELIQCDTELKTHITITNKNELQKMPIEGLGGTTLTPGIQYVAGHKDLKGLNLLILTDGYTDHLDFTGFRNKCLILTTGVECPLIPGNNTKVKQIIIDKSEENGR